MNTAELVVGYLCGIVIVAMFILIWIVLHMAYSQMDVMLENLKNCSAVMVQAPLRNGGPWGKLLLVGWIAGVVTFPGFYLKHGGASVEDLNNFPASLKRKLVAIKWAAIGLLGSMTLLAFIGKSGVLK